MLSSVLNQEIPVDIIPIKIPHEEISFMNEINSGETIYEKRDKT